jgi:RimJ/RimL family protein N-acetyltransferase
MMMYYPVTGKDIILNPLYEDKSLTQLRELCERKDFLENSRVYSCELNLSESTSRLKQHLSLPDYWFHNRLFIIINKKENNSCGITGVRNIDWIERRAELVLLMDNTSMKMKMSHEPIKLLLKQIFREWRLRRVWIKVYSKDTPTITVLKSFGFSREGALRQELFMDGDYLDIEILGLLDKEFHCVEEG